MKEKGSREEQCPVPGKNKTAGARNEELLFPLSLYPLTFPRKSVNHEMGSPVLPPGCLHVPGSERLLFTVTDRPDPGCGNPQ